MTTPVPGAGSAAERDRWIVRPRPLRGLRLRLFCVPYAGAGASAYRSWPDHLSPAGIEVAAIQLPGRESRIREAPEIDVDALADAVAERCEAEPDVPYALFGHSMGARVAFEVARRLRRRSTTAGGAVAMPRHLLVAGCPAPHLRHRGECESRLPDDEFARRLSAMGGTPAEVLDNAELRSLVLPVIRSDFRWVDDYVYVPDPPLPTPILAFGGTHDPLALPDQVAAWGSLTAGRFESVVLPGDHFFITSSREALLAHIAAALSASC